MTSLVQQDGTRAVVIGGPTASGKSALALDVAEAFGGVVINADSMQIYREMRVLTARPTSEDEARVPHRLYGALPVTERCSAARWRDLALAEIRTAAGQGRLPVVVGGTGLYLRALMEGLADIPSVPEAVRDVARERHRALGGEAFRAELVARDPAAARLFAGDTQRLVRAWEVLEATGRPLSAWQEQSGNAPEGLRFLVFVLDPPREALYAACNGRFLTMMEAGAPEEVQAMEAIGLAPDLPAAKALGLPELRACLRGELTRGDAVRLAQQATRRYAKRQGTWFRHQVIGRSAGAAVAARSIFREQYSESLSQKIISIIRESG
ncbi:MAG TPA: tRNA (adenosine(37)-N6)-dimethylallyltransferase MiaA [Azospirillaceae bacterium]|nr:tRNA (adenosine(37)-N6)-dimethylallyltransferase MiaA [Azospirillaceae bacterium]